MGGITDGGVVGVGVLLGAIVGWLVGVELALGLAEGDGLDDGLGDGLGEVQPALPWVPVRKSSDEESLLPGQPLPSTIPSGCLYQSL